MTNGENRFLEMECLNGQPHENDRPLERRKEDP